MRETCAGCKALQREKWPKGAAAYICAATDKPAWVGRRRVLDYRANGRFEIPPRRPAWCDKKEEGENENGDIS